MPQELQAVHDPSTASIIHKFLHFNFLEKLNMPWQDSVSVPLPLHGIPAYNGPLQPFWDLVRVPVPQVSEHVDQDPQTHWPSARKVWVKSNLFWYRAFYLCYLHKYSVLCKPLVKKANLTLTQSSLKPRPHSTVMLWRSKLRSWHWSCTLMRSAWRLSFGKCLNISYNENEFAGLTLGTPNL